MAPLRRKYCKSCEQKQSTRRTLLARKENQLYGWFNRRKDRWSQHKSNGGDLSFEEYVLHVEAKSLKWTVQKHWIPKKKMKKSSNQCKQCGVDCGIKIYCSVNCSWKWRYRNQSDMNTWERVRSQFKKWHTNGKQSKLTKSLGYNRQELASHLERNFQHGMSWKNYGDWHIDHIIPKSWFNPNDYWELRACWSLQNLQPLWKKDNWSKGNRASLRDVADVLESLRLFNINMYSATVQVVHRNIDKAPDYNEFLERQREIDSCKQWMTEEDVIVEQAMTYGGWALEYVKQQCPHRITLC